MILFQRKQERFKEIMYFLFYASCVGPTQERLIMYVWFLNFRYMLKENGQFVVDFEEGNT